MKVCVCCIERRGLNMFVWSAAARKKKLTWKSFDMFEKV